MTTFEEATESIRVQYGKRRISNFAKKNSVSNEEVEVVDETPINDLVNGFKKSCNPPIRVRIYKNLSEEQKQAWIAYYTANAKLALRVKEGSSGLTHKTKKAFELVNNSNEVNEESGKVVMKRSRKTNSNTVPLPIENETKRRKHHKSTDDDDEEKIEKVEKKVRKSNKKEVKPLTDNEIVEHIIKTSEPVEKPETKHRKHRKHTE